MDEYIEREEIRRGYEKLIRSYVNGDSYIADWRFDEMIENLPATDVAPVRHGRWERRIFAFDFYRCSECSGVWSRMSNYCPNCGADMREKED